MTISCRVGELHCVSMYSIWIHTYIQLCMWLRIYLYLSKHRIHSKIILHYICGCYFACTYTCMYTYTLIYICNIAMQLIIHSYIYYIYIHKHAIYSTCMLTPSIYSYCFVSTYELKMFEFIQSSIIATYCTWGDCGHKSETYLYFLLNTHFSRNCWKLGHILKVIFFSGGVCRFVLGSFFLWKVQQSKNNL